MLNIYCDRKKISDRAKATVKITSDEPMTMMRVFAVDNSRGDMEAATDRMGFGQGKPILAGGEEETIDSALTHSFTLQASDFSPLGDGRYITAIYVANKDGSFNCENLLLLENGYYINVGDSEGSTVYVKPADETSNFGSYTSRYKGEEIDGFITAVSGG